MSQWGQPGFQYPMQTGVNPQLQQGFPQGGLAPQPTGFPGQRPGGFLQSQQTGFPGAPGFQQPQQTGFQNMGSGFQQRPPVPPVPPVPPMPSQFQQQNQGPGFLGQQQPQNRFMSPSIQSQPTGFPGMGRGGGPGGMPPAAPLVPQITGFVDPRLQMMSSTFMPVNPSAPYGAGGMPQLPPQPQQLGAPSLQQSIQQLNEETRGTAAPKMPWALSKAEKKSYDNMFRAWDLKGTGFIDGQTARGIFGQSGLDNNDLARIWTLADADNRGKLNIQEFHVAMGLIYRRLNGNPIPDELPPELIPPSHRDLDSSVDFLKQVLKDETRARSPSAVDAPVSRLKERSFTSSGAAGAGGRQDATVYRHQDPDPGRFYQPRSRHLDRDAVRVGNESPADDLSDIKRQLDNTAKMLDRAAEENASRTAEDEALDRELSDLRYRVKRVQEDLDYASRGPRSQAKDEDRRGLERELLKLMHERVPEVERKIKDREERKEREKREWTRERDRRNDRFGRYDDRDDKYSSSRRYDDLDRDRGRYLSSYDRDDRGRDRDRDYSRDRDYERDRSYERDRERDRGYDRRPSPPAARSPPPPPPEVSASRSLSKPPPPPAPSASPAPGTKNMTPEERREFIRQEAQRRMQERMAALGVTTPGGGGRSLDTSVADRLAQEKKEAEEKSKEAERLAEERERLRRERLEGEKALKDGRATPQTPAAPSSPAPPTPTAAATPKPSAPPAPKRAPAPPPPRKGAIRPPVALRVSPAPPPPAPPTAPSPVSLPGPPASNQTVIQSEVDPEEQRLKEREEALRKQREERLARIRQMEQEEEEARKAEEEYQARRRAFANASSPAPPAAAVSSPLPQPEPAATPTVPPPSPPPPALLTPAPPAASPPEKAGTNPFSRMMKDGASATPTPPAANGGTNPFFRSQTVPPPAPPTPTSSVVPPPKSATPVPVKSTYHTAPSDDSDWDDVQEKEDDDSSDDEIATSRQSRSALAQELFGSILPPTRPQSEGPPTPKSTAAAPPPPAAPLAPPAPAPPAAPPIPTAPAPPPAPAAPPPPFASSTPPAPPGGRNALLSAIQSGARLRKAVTNDRSSAPVSGRVLGDAAPPDHINAAPRPPSPPSVSEPPPPPEPAVPLPTMSSMDSRSSNRQSVDWYAGLAAEQGGTHQEQLPPTVEEEEDYEVVGRESPNVPDIQVSEHEVPGSASASDPMEDVDTSINYRVRSLYAYEGQRPEDLNFGENLVLTAHPSKSGGDWWHGILLKDGKSGFFPKTYVQVLDNVVKAKALYAYTGGSADELPLAEGDEVVIVDRSEPDWWKAEQGGVIFIVPAAYLEVIEGDSIFLQIQTSGDEPLARQSSERDRAVVAGFVQSAPEDDSDDSDVTSDEEYLSFSDSESESETDAERDRQREREARELERQRVLEAAGLVVKQDETPPPKPQRKRSVRRRPPPAIPQRSSILSITSEKELPGPPPSDADENVIRLDDAFERYEAFKQTKGHASRLSTSSFDTGPPSPQPPLSPSSTLARTVSRESDGGRSYSHLLHFLGRRTPGQDQERRTMPIISGPITDRPITPIQLEGDSSFGSSWSSLVDKTALEEIPTNERRRQEATFELIATESAYVRDLQLIVEVFYSSLMSVLDTKAITVIFANVEDILLTNTTFLSSLEERQKQCRLYIDRIGDILENNMSKMGVYMDYCVNQATAIKVLQSMRETNSELSTQLQRLREDPIVRNLDLSSYLLVPMQRITRYPLLIKQILHYTELAEDRERIEHALEVAERILDHINESIREQEGRERLKAISRDLWIGQGRLDLTAPTRYMGPRRLLKEGSLAKAKSGRKLRGFLCSDIMVLTDETAKSLYRMPIPLSEVQVHDIPGSKDDSTFQLALPYPRGGETIKLKALSVRDCQLWTQAVESASDKCKAAEKRARRKVPSI